MSRSWLHWNIPHKPMCYQLWTKVLVKELPKALAEELAKERAED